jgi:hypothetical protein
MLLIILISRKFPWFEKATERMDILGYLRNALDTAYLLGYQAGQQTAEPPEVFAGVLRTFDS